MPVYGYSYHYHYIEIPDEEVSCPIVEDNIENYCWINYSRDCKNDDCSVAAIIRYASDLIEGNATLEHPGEETSSWIPRCFLSPSMAENRRLYGDPMRESLMFLTHLIGDVHAPLHNGLASDFGGDWIPVTFFNTTLYDTPESWLVRMLCEIPFFSWLTGSLCGRQMHLVSRCFLKYVSCRLGASHCCLLYMCIRNSTRYGMVGSFRKYKTKVMEDLAMPWN